MECKLKTFVLTSGERYCILVDSESDLPLFYPNLYITTQIRNRSLSYSTMEATLNGISVLIKFLDKRNDNIEKRIQENRFFQENELDAVKDFCQLNFRSINDLKNRSNLLPFSKKKKSDKKVSRSTEYVRITVIAEYIIWLSQILEQKQISALQINKLEKSLKARRPERTSRNSELDNKGLNEEQIELLFEIFRPDSELNPFKERSVRTRNRLIFLMLYHLGLRGGELLNIRIRDIDFTKNQLVIARRADEKDDPRTFQPLVKTLDRRLPIKDTLAKEIHYYILKERRKISHSIKNDFLFITHKAGPSQGQPLSKSGYKKVVAVVRNASPTLYSLTGHQLRHTWNEIFSNHMDLMDQPPSEEQQEKMRSYLMGWKENSGSAAHYNKRFVKRKANEAALQLQDGMIRLPKEQND